jgi:hypothetical protein
MVRACWNGLQEHYERWNASLNGATRVHRWNSMIEFVVYYVHHTIWEDNNRSTWNPGHKEFSMNYTQLGRSGLKVTPLCLGTMNFGSNQLDLCTTPFRIPQSGLVSITTCGTAYQIIQQAKGA